jgi:mannan endo-1,4-beta-mannosidase
MAIHKIPAQKHSCYTGAFLGEGTLSNRKLKPYENKIGSSPKIVMWFHAFGKGFSFPVLECMAAKSWGAMPFIKIEPWSWKGKNDDSFSLERIVKGEFDKDILRFARGAKSAKTRLFLSFGHEMNADWYPWAGNPKMYKLAYLHVYDIFRQAKAKNVTWVFNPNADPHNEIAKYYPGSEFVDWLGLDGFNWGATQKWSKWQSFSDIFMKSYDALCKLAVKPILIAEFGSTEIGGDKAEWIENSLIMIRMMRRIGGFVWFDTNKETDWRIDSSPESLKAYKDSLKDPYFI